MTECVAILGILIGLFKRYVRNLALAFWILFTDLTFIMMIIFKSKPVGVSVTSFVTSFTVVG